MKLLVYGAGVIGCELAHALAKTNHDVTILARGDWKNTLKVKGLTIRHYAQLNTTHDEIKVIEQLKSEDKYDLVFVVMRQEQIPTILPVLSRNKSEYFIFIGNNLKAPEVERRLKQNSTNHKEIAFGFQGTGGRRENEKVISIHTKVGMTVGALDGEMSRELRHRLKEAFTGANYRLTKEVHMDAWLKCHAAFILPACYVCYQLKGKIRHTTKQQINQIIDATIEAYDALKSLGYPIRPDGQEAFFHENRAKCYALIWVLMKTPIGRLAVSDHAMNAKREFKTIDQIFEAMWSKANYKMKVWNQLREESGIKKEGFENG